MTEVPTRWLAVESDNDAVETQSRFKSFIKWIYQLTSVKQSADVLTGCQSILKKSVHYENSRQRDQLMQLTVLSKVNTLSMYVSSVDDLSILFQKLSPTVNDFFENCFWQTEFCEAVENVNWISTEQFKVIR